MVGCESILNRKRRKVLLSIYLQPTQLLRNFAPLRLRGKNIPEVTIRQSDGLHIPPMITSP